MNGADALGTPSPENANLLNGPNPPISQAALQRSDFALHVTRCLRTPTWLVSEHLRRVLPDWRSAGSAARDAWV